MKIVRDTHSVSAIPRFLRDRTPARAESTGGHNEDSRGDHVGIATHALRVRETKSLDPTAQRSEKSRSDFSSWVRAQYDISKKSSPDGLLFFDGPCGDRNP